jgi:hypothetical protein
MADMANSLERLRGVGRVDRFSARFGRDRSADRGSTRATSDNSGVLWVDWRYAAAVPVQGTKEDMNSLCLQ